MIPSLQELFEASGLTFSARQVAQFERLVEELLRWNQCRNLTAITDQTEVFEKHLVDSLTLMPYAGNARRLLDLGSGAGFPALPLKIACPALEVVAVDAVAKKVAFQRHVVRALGLLGYTALHCRAEGLIEQPLCRQGFDLVTARALGPLPMLTALAKPCLTAGGRLLAMKGGEVDEELQLHGEALAAAGWKIALHHLRLPRSGAERCLVEMALEKAN